MFPLLEFWLHIITAGSCNWTETPTHFDTNYTGAWHRLLGQSEDQGLGDYQSDQSVKMAKESNAHDLSGAAVKIPKPGRTENSTKERSQHGHNPPIATAKQCLKQKRIELEITLKRKAPNFRLRPLLGPSLLFVKASSLDSRGNFGQSLECRALTLGPPTSDRSVDLGRICRARATLPTTVKEKTRGRHRARESPLKGASGSA